MTDETAEAEADGAVAPAARREAVRERYGGLAAGDSSCCDDGGCGCGATGDRVRELGYSEDDVAAADVAADLSLGCGNPTAIASLEEGDAVLDLGSGGGFDCFLAAREVGESGRVVGVDMTPEMVERARRTARERDATNVEFRLGEMEHLPVADASVDVVVSNCAVNLSPDEPRVFREAYRVLRPGGRLAISDVVATADPPADLRADPESVAACVGGASSIPALEAALSDAGFVDVAIEPDEASDEFVTEWDDERDPSEFVVAATIEARKPESERVWTTARETDP